MNRVAAWGVHLLTASGVVLAVMALAAVEQGAFHAALLWLLAALAIDGIDGALARKLRVAEHLPQIDGAALDLVVDYLTYVLVPVLLLWRGPFLPPSIDLPLCAAILLSSLYVFARRDMKTDDGYFCGFPALWNVVAAYFVLVPILPWAAAAISLVLIALTFAPIHVVHPFRTRDNPVLALLAAVVWVVAMVALLALPAQLAGWRPEIIGVSLAALLVMLAIGLRRTFRARTMPTI